MVELQNVRYILMDIEGTTSDIAFVKDVLFPYSARELRNYVSSNKNNPEVRACINHVLEETGKETDEDAISQLLEWIRSDVKNPALKVLQGKIWQKGFESNTYKAHLYDEVLPAWQRWKSEGIRLGIYSSGSVKAQHLFFEHNEKGNLLSYLENFFDLKIGSKRDATSYREITARLGLPPDEILFLSDVPEELDAATFAGLQALQVVRPGTTPDTQHRTVSGFNEILISNSLQ